MVCVRLRSCFGQSRRNRQQAHGNSDSSSSNHNFAPALHDRGAVTISLRLSCALFPEASHATLSCSGYVCHSNARLASRDSANHVISDLGVLLHRLNLRAALKLSLSSEVHW